jgi:hypothetical protein
LAEVAAAHHQAAAVALFTAAVVVMVVVHYLVQVLEVMEDPVVMMAVQVAQLEHFLVLALPEALTAQHPLLGMALLEQLLLVI